MICQHFGICGGCSFQDVEYPVQLKNKHDRVTGLLSQFECGNVHPIIPSENIFRYRNKVELAFGDEKDTGKNMLGFRQKNRFSRIVNIEDCLLISEKANSVVHKVRNWVNKSGLPVYNQVKHTGFFRYLVMRETSTGELMVNLIVNCTAYQFEYEHKSMFAEFAASFGADVTSFFTGVNDTKSDVARVDKIYLLAGRDCITEQIGNYKYRISPTTFFQTNKFTVNSLYSTIKQYAAGDNGIATCLDIYCGSGTISIFVSDLFDKVIGIESNPDSVADALKNIELNKIKNCEFVTERAEVMLGRLFETKFNVRLSTVIVDPPRPGLAKSVVSSLMELNPNKIVYVSCNPETLVNDLQAMTKFYRITDIQAVDMFPHTPHVETVVKLAHK